MCRFMLTLLLLSIKSYNTFSSAGTILGQGGMTESAEVGNAK